MQNEDKLQRINRAALKSFSVLQNQELLAKGQKSGLGNALQSKYLPFLYFLTIEYVEDSLINKLKRNTWNWIVVNKRNYIEFLATNWNKLKNWYFKHGEENQINEFEKKEMTIDRKFTLPSHFLFYLVVIFK